FDPVMREEERRIYNDGPPVDPEILTHAAHLRWAEAILFVYPTWWYGLPAMLKGWLERVWAPGVAFALPVGKGPLKPVMPHLKTIGVAPPCGAPRWWSFLVGQPRRKTILRGIRALCARRCRTLYLAHYPMDPSSPHSRAVDLREVETRLARF